MPTLPFGRAFKTGQDAWATQQEAYDHRRYGLSKRTVWNVSPNTVTSAYNASYNEVVRADPTSAAFTITLPLAKDQQGATLIIKKDSNSANAITIVPRGTEQIDGGTSTFLSIPRGSLTFISDGTNWIIV